jgi:hypothetical protein
MAIPDGVGFSLDSELPVKKRVAAPMGWEPVYLVCVLLSSERGKKHSAPVPVRVISHTVGHN